MRVLQLLPTLAYGDAVGNHALSILHLLQTAGCETAIYAEWVEPRAVQPGVYRSADMPALCAEDVLIYHFSIASPLHKLLADFPCKKIMIYHNITPAKYFEEYALNLYQQCSDGRKELAALKTVFDYAIAVSQYNKDELVKLGFTCPVDVVPVLLPFDDYKRPADPATLCKYKDGVTNILFVGRTAPNKKQEDAIAAFYYYQTYYNPQARLILVGDLASAGGYILQLMEYRQRLDLYDVVFTGKIPFAQILAFYQVADAFLCMSEHEGFCVPLIESMLFDVPIVARAAAAVPETLGEGGILMPEDASPALAAATLHRLLSDDALRADVVAKQRTRLQDFTHETVAASLMDKLRPFLHS